MFLKSTTDRGGNEVDRANNQMKKNVHWTEYFFFIKFYMDGYIIYARLSSFKYWLQWIYVI